LPEVEEISDGFQNAENVISGSQEETSPVRRIVIGLSTKNPVETSTGYVLRQI
jgi:hypothetical protein